MHNTKRSRNFLLTSTTLTNEPITTGAIMSLPQIPAPLAATSFWRTELDALDSSRSTEELPQECDVVIIGAGYSGASTAYHLVQDNDFPPSIVILESREACSGASARNGMTRPSLLRGRHISLSIALYRRPCQARCVLQHPEVY